LVDLLHDRLSLNFNCANIAIIIANPKKWDKKMQKKSNHLEKKKEMDGAGSLIINHSLFQQ